MITQDIKLKLKSALEQAFAEAGKKVIVTPTLYPASEEGNDQLEVEAKSKADNGIVYIGRDPKFYGEPTGGIYSFDDPYLILIYINDKNKGEERIEDLYDIARECLHKLPNFKLSADHIVDVKGYKSGLYVAWIRIVYTPSFY